MDYGASNHITSSVNKLSDVMRVQNSPKMKLPTRATGEITHKGNLKLIVDLSIRNVLCEPKFKHNLIYVQKLAKDENCS